MTQKKVRMTQGMYPLGRLTPSLAHEDQALPRTWNETARLLNTVPGQSGWTDRKAENVVDGVRQRLTAAGTLAPEDLQVLRTGIGD